MLNGFVVVETVHDLVPVGLYLRIRNGPIHEYVHVAQSQIMLQKHESNRLSFFGRIYCNPFNKLLVKLTRRGHDGSDFYSLAGKLINLARMWYERLARSCKMLQNQPDKVTKTYPTFIP